MRRRPSFNLLYERWLELGLGIEGIPADLGAHGLFLEFGRAPDDGRAHRAQQRRSPHPWHEQRCGNEQKTEAHHVRPPQVAQVILAPDHPHKAEADDEQGCQAQSQTKEVHSDCSSRGRLTTCPIGSRSSQLTVVADSLSASRRAWRGLLGLAGAWPCLMRLCWRENSSASHSI